MGKKTNDAPTILIVDRDSALADKISGSLSENGVYLEHVFSVKQGIALLERYIFEAVLLRDELEGGLNSESIAAFKMGEGTPEVIIFTNKGDPDQAENAIRLGAWEYLVDTSPENALPDIVRRVLHYRKNKPVEKTHEREAIRTKIEKTRPYRSQRCHEEVH